MTKTDTNDTIQFFFSKTYAKPFYLANKYVCLGAHENIHHPWLHQRCLQIYIFSVGMINQFIFFTNSPQIDTNFTFSFFLMLLKELKDIKIIQHRSTVQYRHYKWVLPLAPEHARKHIFSIKYKLFHHIKLFALPILSETYFFILCWDEI